MYLSHLDFIAERREEPQTSDTGEGPVGVVTRLWRRQRLRRAYSAFGLDGSPWRTGLASNRLLTNGEQMPNAVSFDNYGHADSRMPPFSSELVE
jgi:hypothetical protein